MSFLSGIYLSRYEVIIQWSVGLSRMDIESQFFDLLAEFIFGDLHFVLELADEFVYRGLHGGWPDGCLPFLPQVIIMRDLVRMLLGIVGDLPLMGTGGTVAAAWRYREDSRQGGGSRGGMGGGGNGGMEVWEEATGTLSGCSLNSQVVLIYFCT